MKVKLHHNGDDVFIAWKAAFIPECRGFALFRRRNGVEEIVSTWVGFENQEHEVGERRASTNWPIQKYQWTDYMANVGDKLQYRVVPMVGPDSSNLRADTKSASAWTKAIELKHEVADKIEVFFNRGIVASQWVSRRLGVTADDVKGAKLKKEINDPKSDLRRYLYGPLGDRLFKLLKTAAARKREIYAVLYELDDEELIARLLKFGQRAHVVLANGSVKKSGEDQNEKARSRLRGKVDLSDRMISPRALGHNKFLVIADKGGKPRWVWTGSQNWTDTGLCTQANNSVLIDDFGLAEEYRKQWERLVNAGSDTPDSLLASNSQARSHKLGTTKIDLWFTPTIAQVDLAAARSLIQNAKEAVLFLMFNPGPKDSLLNKIIETARKGAAGKRLYVKGAINQDPSTTKSPVHLFDGQNSVKTDYSVVLPAAIDAPTKWFLREIKKLPAAFAMIHSKVVLVDPFGKNPLVMTGSHNLGPKASGINDENFLLISGAPGIASAYATNIMSIYNQYRWRFRRLTQPKAKRWNGLVDNDAWQTGYLKPGGAARREIDFWT